MRDGHHQSVISRASGRIVAAVALLLAGLPPAIAQDRFDVFLGFNDFVPESSWFPVVCEIDNQGPGFSGMVEISGGSFNDDTRRLLPLELPSGTTKRVTLPVFFDGSYGAGWNVRLLDSKRRVVDEKLNLRASKQVKPESVLMGSISRSGAWSPRFEPLKRKQSELDPVAARIPVQVFPENPLVLTGMDALYLNSEKAVDLRLAQQQAIANWIRLGGQLIVGVESISDVNSGPWLRSLVPVRLTGVTTIQAHPELQEWLRSPLRSASAQSSMIRPFSELTDDLTFETADLQIATGEPLAGRVLVSAGNHPLIVQAPYGLGRVTALMFSPEREPFKSWKNQPVMWSRLAGVPPEWYASDDQQHYGRWASDGIFGAMIDSRQVRKLPVGWLLLLLVAYLVVIGPFDRWWLKKIGKPMLTWITFPLYVVLFSGLIYVIGYKLRAGEREWNELHVVDVIAAGEQAQLRGRTYGSLYSPVNDSYRMRGPEKLAMFRGEAASAWGGGGSSESITVIQIDDTFESEVYVPVWTSQLFVNDWWVSGTSPIKVRLNANSGRLVCDLENVGERPLSHVRLVWGGRVFEFGELAAKESRQETAQIQQGVFMNDFLSRLNANTYQNTVQQRGRAFGGSTSGRIENKPDGCFVASFLGSFDTTSQYTQFVAPPGTDLGFALADNALLLAFAEGEAVEAGMNDFTARRGEADTFWRIPIPLTSRSQNLP